MKLSHLTETACENNAIVTTFFEYSKCFFLLNTTPINYKFPSFNSKSMAKAGLSTS